MRQAQRLYHLLGDVEERYVLEAAEVPRKKATMFFLKTVAIAACAAILVCGGYGVWQWQDLVGAMSFENVYVPTGSSAIGSSAMMVLLGTTLDELYEEADVVVIAKVTEHKPTEYGEKWMTHCLSAIRILTAYKGEVTKGEELIVREIGSRKGESDEEHTLDGVPLLHKDMCVLLFLRAGIKNEDGTVTHTICGEYQGKFIFDTNGMLHESAEYGCDAVTVIEDMESMHYETVTEKLCLLQAGA